MPTYFVNVNTYLSKRKTIIVVTIFLVLIKEAFIQYNEVIY